MRIRDYIRDGRAMCQKRDNKSGRVIRRFLPHLILPAIDFRYTKPHVIEIALRDPLRPIHP
ncbi:MULTISPECIES: hypothetical protein [unclassified Pantoea]|uniref:hypothetical protein n=1 Tax=unclassified Pantoea TaxID=2630326 RepID=UPI00226A7E89|nr:MULTISPECIES: hypothetical protein [unclassified Pantoea]